jgi:DNA-directed RNA polymerase specialized sigma subunit
MPFSEQYRRAAGLTTQDELGQRVLSWQKNPDKHQTGLLLRELDPVINRAIQAHTGTPNPLMRSRARRMALEALRRYDPAQGTKISTYLFGQLHGLKRVARRQQQVLTVPERVSLERGRLQRATQDLQDELGREPSEGELGDRMGLSVKRIENIRRFGNPVAESQLQNVGTGGLYRPAVEQQDSEAWLDFVRSDLDPMNQKIMDHTLGRQGVRMLSNQDLANQLKLSPGAVSQRKAQIQQKLDLEQDLSPFGS